MAAAIVSGISALIGIGASAAGGAAADKASKEQVKNQYKRDKDQWKYENAKAKDQWNYEKSKINNQKANNEAELKFREETEKQNWEQQMSIRQASYDAKKDEYKAAEKEAKNQERINEKSYNNATAQQDQWLEDQKTEKYFADEKASLALAQTMDKAEDLYGAAETKYGQTVRDTNLAQKDAKREYKAEKTNLNLANRELEDQGEYEKEARQLEIDQYGESDAYIKADEEAAQAGFLNEQAQAFHDLSNKIDRKNLDRDQEQAMFDYESELAGYQHDFVKDNAGIDKVLAKDTRIQSVDSAKTNYQSDVLDTVYNKNKSDNQIEQENAARDITKDRLTSELKQNELEKDYTVDQSVNQDLMNDLENDLAQDTGDSNIKDLQNKLDKFIAGKNFEKEDTWVKKLQATGAAAASGRAGMSAAAARQSVVAEMGRQSARLDDSILRGTKETNHLQDFERTKQAFSTDKLSNQKTAEKLKRDNAKDKYNEKSKLKTKEDKYADDSTKSKTDQLEDDKTYQQDKLDKISKERRDTSIAAAESTFQHAKDKLVNTVSQSKGQTRRLKNKLGSQKEYTDAKANDDIDTFNDNYNLTINDINARSEQSAIDADRKTASNANKMALIQKNLDKSLNAMGYAILRNDNKMEVNANKFNAQKEAFDNQKLDAKENMGIAKSDARRTVKIAKQNEKLDKKVREENLNSAVQQNKFDQKKLKIGKLSSDLKADAMRLPKPNIGPEIPQPFTYPRTSYVLPEKPLKAPKPIKGAANTSNMMQAIGSSIAGINWGNIIK